MKRKVGIILSLMITLTLLVGISAFAAAPTPAKDFKFDAKTGTITKYVGKSKAVVIPSKIGGKLVKAIGAKAFLGNSKLTSISMSNSVTSIGEGAFKNCKGLKSITIPKSVNEIAVAAFGGCKSLTSITIPSSVTFIGEDAFHGCSVLTIKCPIGSYPHRYAAKNGIKYVIIKE